MEALLLLMPFSAPGELISSSCTFYHLLIHTRAKSHSRLALPPPSPKGQPNKPLIEGGASGFQECEASLGWQGVCSEKGESHAASQDHKNTA